MGLLKKFAGWAGATVVVGGLFLGLVAEKGGFGSRNTREVYSFQYSGKNARVIEDDRIMAFNNRFHIELNNGDRIYNGVITSDDNKEIEVTGTNRKADSYSIRDKAKN